MEELEKHYKVIDFLLILLFFIFNKNIYYYFYYFLFSTISTLVKCVKCDGKVQFQLAKREGLGFNIKVSCDSCKQNKYVPSRARINSGIYEVNFRFVFVMRILGLELAGCEKFCGLMDLSSSFLAKSTYNDYIKKMCSIVKEIAN